MSYSQGGHEWIDVRAIDGTAMRIALDQIQHIEPRDSGCDVYFKDGSLLLIGEDLTKRLVRK